MIGTTIRIDVRTTLINYNSLDKKIENKRNGLYFKILLVIARRVIYTLYLKEDQLVKNNIISYEFIKNI